MKYTDGANGSLSEVQKLEIYHVINRDLLKAKSQGKIIELGCT